MTVSCELTLKLVHGAEAQFVEAAPFFDEALAHFVEADFRAPFKPRADVLIVGHGYAPQDEAEVDRLLLRVRIGEWSKAVRVTGDRFWLREGGRLVPGPPRKFRRIMLTGERAPRSAENPQGIDVEAVPVEHRIALPNLEAASVGYSPILGPVPPNAPSRAGLVHPTAPGWVHALLSGHRAGPPPESFNFGYFNLAPFDQQLPEIPIGAAIVLENLHAQHAIFTSRFPSVRPRAFVFDPQALQQLEIPLRCDTLWVDADREIASFVFRGVIPISHPDLATQVMTRVETVERAAPATSVRMNETQMGTDMVGGGLPFTKAGPSTPTPPVADASTAARSRPPGIARPTVKLSAPAIPGGGFVTQEILVGAGLGALPFGGRPAPHHEDETTQSLGDDPTTATSYRLIEPPARPPSVPPDDPTPRPYTPHAAHRRSLKLLPPDIGPTPPPPLPPRSMRASEPAPVSHTLPGITPERRPGSTRPGTPSAEEISSVSLQVLSLRPPPSPQLGALQLGTGKLHSVQLSKNEGAAAPSVPASAGRQASVASDPAFVEAPSTFENSPTPPTVSRSSAPPRATSTEPAAGTETPTRNAPTSDAPTAIKDGRGPVPIRTKADQEATFNEEMTDSSTSDRRGVEARTLEEADADADRDAMEFPLPPSDGFEVDGVTLDHCAAIRAAIAMPQADRAAVLRKHKLDEAAFARIEKTHLGRIDQETSNGAQDLLNRYDAAYVAAQDVLRRPIGVKEYARIVVARQTGDIAEVMSELGVPRSELMRIDRVWKRRMIDYPEVDKTLKSLIESLGKKQ